MLGLAGAALQLGNRTSVLGQKQGGLAAVYGLPSWFATMFCRPGQGAGWQAVLRQRVLDSVAACQGTVVVHTGSWRHDLDQARCLPTRPGLNVQVGHSIAAAVAFEKPLARSEAPAVKCKGRVSTRCNGLQIYSVDSHRLALALDRRGMLVQVVRSAVLQAMGLTNKEALRLANLY
jgi:hypothetical protein